MRGKNSRSRALISHGERVVCMGLCMCLLLRERLSWATRVQQEGREERCMFQGGKLCKHGENVKRDRGSLCSNRRRLAASGSRDNGDDQDMTSDQVGWIGMAGARGHGASFS